MTIQTPLLTLDRSAKVSLVGQIWTGIEAVPMPVDAEGLDVAAGIARAPKAALALVTPGQQAPLGMALSLARRRALLDWAERAGARLGRPGRPNYSPSSSPMMSAGRW